MNRRLLFVSVLPLVLACGPFFYSAPPPLPEYPERTAVKPWRLLLDEAHAPSGEAKEGLVAEVEELIGELSELPVQEAQQRIEALRQRNRNGEFSIKLANLLLEMQELVKLPLPAVDLADYLKRRIQWVPGHEFVTRPPTRDWRISDEQFAEMLEAHRAQLAARAAEYGDWLESCPPALKPNVRIRRGAFHFHARQLEAALADFEAVIKAYPDHPRAEVAAFMRGRGLLELARELEALKQQAQADAELGRRIGEVREQSREAFEHYLEVYPEGRFRADVIGWLGGLDLDEGNLVSAINRQMLRYECQPTREVAHSVMRELDVLLPMAYQGERHQVHGIDFERAVRLPGLTRQMVYHALDPAAQGQIRGRNEGMDGGQEVLDRMEGLRVRSEPWSRDMIAGLARAVVKSGRPVDGLSGWVLGWSLLQAQQPAQALAILERTGEVNAELLQLKAKACHQLGRYDQARAALAQVIELDPKGPLAEVARLDHALETYRIGQAGEAMLELLSFVEEDSAHSLMKDQAIQWIDVLAQFGPLRELRDTLEAMPEHHPHLEVMRMVVRSRYLCRGAFDTASRYLDPPRKQEERGHHPSSIEGCSHLDQERWDAEVAALAGTLAELKSASGARKARLHLRAAHHWASLRGRLTLPLHRFMDFSASENERLDELRRVNGRVLELGDRWLVRELDERDELHHALSHWRAVLRMEYASPHMTRQALFRANEALFELAEFSPYRLSRAVEEGHGEWSKSWVERLQREFPDSEEARAAIAYEFKPPALLDQWMPGNWAPWALGEEVEEILDQISWEERRLAHEKWEQVRQGLNDLARSKDPAADTSRLLREFESIRPLLERREILGVVDEIDDLHAVAHCEGVSAQLFVRYVQRRQQLDGSPMDGGEVLEPFLDYLDALSRAGAARNAADGHALRQEIWEQYLRDHPASPKAEAARLRLLRLQVRDAIGYPRFRVTRFPEAPIAIGYKSISFDPDLAGFNRPELLRAIAAYRQDHPRGRYTVDVDLLEGSLHAASGDPAKALPLLLQVLKQARHAELRQDAGMAFCVVITPLFDGLERADLVAALRANPAAFEIIDLLAGGNTPFARLWPMLPYLQQEP
ncbi:MAG: tetratricopeptide repeat protein [Akkermansiaceae bacterium]|nr:tetratricopeptide repeat protein [Akkermansiaceae bacterium]